MPFIIPSLAVKNPKRGCKSRAYHGPIKNRMKKFVAIRRNKARGNYRLTWHNAEEKEA
tara:strand:+ start:76 stop:249 length:174 start_codon:yes stop_codon:yes gene_type:complete